MTTIVIDKNIPFIGDSLDSVANVVALPAEEITPQAVADADALLVRTYTRCDAALLGNSKVRFVGTGTIGTDHLDLAWMAANGIKAVNAPECNAPAVAQYVLASILTLFPDPEGMTVGIVGVGNVGSIVERWCRQLGMHTLMCDPPKAAGNIAGNYVSLSQIARQSDIITFHTPHTREPHPWPTHHLADSRFFNALQRKPVIINSARGPVTDTEALLHALDNGQVSQAVIDCWEGEPASISTALAHKAAIATPHIAGYSIEGKKRATQTIVNALLAHLGSDRRIDLGVSQGAATDVTKESILASYDPMADTRYLLDGLETGRPFAWLRNNYTLRHETR
ncbi:MAG: 4-phosphoerythronate dehydrogenase [Muribaculaceae bacterium]|nr:4-phosphoerythronate dehydrogenase [Muribaculaceae bacterium]